MRLLNGYLFGVPLGSSEATGASWVLPARVVCRPAVRMAFMRSLEAGGVRGGPTFGAMDDETLQLYGAAPAFAPGVALGPVVAGSSVSLFYMDGPYVSGWRDALTQTQPDLHLDWAGWWLTLPGGALPGDEEKQVWWAAAAGAGLCDAQRPLVFVGRRGERLSVVACVPGDDGPETLPVTWGAS